MRRSPVLALLVVLLGPLDSMGETRGGDSIESLATDIAWILSQDPTPDELLEAAGVRLSRFLEKGTLPERFERPLPGLGMTTHLLYVDPDGAFSIAALVLGEGVETPLHDHDTWTVWGTWLGKDEEHRYARSGDDPFPDLEPVAKGRFPEDGVSRVPGPPADLHRIRNVGDGRSVSIHVHGADMSRQTRRVYDLERRQVRPFVQSYER